MNLEIDRHIISLIKLALEEDIGSGDTTSNILVPEELSSSAKIIAKEDLVLAGQVVARQVCAQVDGRLNYSEVISDGSSVAEGATVAELSGPMRSILAAERTCLNFLQQLSGIASLTAKYCEALEGSGVELVETRKTTPGHRALEKYATALGGAKNHRIGLYDAVLIKENHLAGSGLSPAEAVKKAKENTKLFVQVEVKDLAELTDAISASPDGVLLDNFSPEQVDKALEILSEKELIVEVSGGVTLESISEYAKKGVSRISVGAITHSAKASDLSLLF